ncbi:MAG TPA: hypothetical protein VIX17_29355 [Pyrinomonadaceae bacterium]
MKPLRLLDVTAFVFGVRRNDGQSAGFIGAPMRLSLIVYQI